MMITFKDTLINYEWWGQNPFGCMYSLLLSAIVSHFDSSVKTYASPMWVLYSQKCKIYHHKTKFHHYFGQKELEVTRISKTFQNVKGIFVKNVPNL